VLKSHPPHSTDESVSLTRAKAAGKGLVPELVRNSAEAGSEHWKTVSSPYLRCGFLEAKDNPERIPVKIHCAERIFLSIPVIKKYCSLRSQPSHVKWLSGSGAAREQARNGGGHR